MSMPKTTWKSFCEKLDMSGGALACWIWKGYVSRRYGVISINNRPVRSNRAAWILNFGPIPDGLVVCHTCDNPLCCNPKHLFLGTTHDNNEDKLKKGRHAYGEKSSSAILKYSDVREIRRLPKTRGSGVRLAKKYGVSPATISAIRVGRNWASVHGDYSQFDGGM